MNDFQLERALIETPEYQNAYLLSDRDYTPLDSDDPALQQKVITVWDKAKDAPSFLAEEDQEFEGLVKDLLVQGAVPAVAAPRGLGKTLVAHCLAVTLALGGLFRGKPVYPVRVLIVDRDDPKKVIKKRLRGWGAQNAANLCLLTREDAPDLRDKKAWQSFPVDKYQVVVIDSIGSSTEGVSEKEGKETT